MGYALPGIFLAVLVLVFLWHRRENSRLSEELSNTLASGTSPRFSHFAWQRTFQLLLAVAVLSAVIVAYDWKYTETTHQVEALSAQAQDAERKYQESLKVQEQLADELQLTQQPPAPQPQAKEPASTVAALFTPEDQAGSADEQMDEIKRRFENVLVLYYFLRKCERVGQDDFFIITTALSQEMASVNAPGRLQYDILTAARGSYREMYAKSDCGGSELPDLTRQYNDYITVLSKNALAE